MRRAALFVRNAPVHNTCIKAYIRVLGGKERVREALEGIVAAMRAAELDEARWPEASALVDEAFGLTGNHLTVMGSGPDGQPEFLFGRLYLHGEPNEEWERDYVENYFVRDERIPRMLALPDGAVRHVDSFYEDRERRSSDTYNGFLVPTGGTNMVTTRAAGPPGLQVFWSFVRSGGPEDWPTVGMDGLAWLLPHIGHFVSVRRALADAQVRGVRTSAQLLDAEGLGVVLLDRHGRIIETNDRARAMLLAGDALSDRDGCLVARQSNECAALHRTLNAALPRGGRMAVGGTVMVRRDAGRPLFVHVSPATGSPDAGLADAAVLVALEDLGCNVPADEQRLGEAFALTRAEQRVAAALVAGGSAAEIADEICRSEATVRWHIQRMKAKFQCRRMTDLVRLFSRAGESSRR